MSTRAILFDLNGVLVDDGALQEMALRIALQTVGLQLDHRQYIKFFQGHTDTNGLSRYLAAIDAPTKDVEAFLGRKYDTYRALAENGLLGYKGVNDFVRAAHQAGYQMAVVTGSTSHEADFVIQTLGLTQYFTVIVAADQLMNERANTRGYALAAQRLRVEPADCWVVENTIAGINAAKRAGMRVVGVTNTASAKQLTKADLIVDHLGAELVHLMQLA